MSKYIRTQIQVMKWGIIGSSAGSLLAIGAATVFAPPIAAAGMFLIPAGLAGGIAYGNRRFNRR